MLREVCLSICAKAILRLISDSLCALVFLKVKSFSFMHAPKRTCKALVKINSCHGHCPLRGLPQQIKARFIELSDESS